MELKIEEFEDSKNEFAEKALTQKNGGGHTEGGAQNESKQGAVKCAPNFGEYGILTRVGIPDCARKKLHTVFAYRWQGRSDNTQNDEHDQKHGEPRQPIAKMTENSVDYSLPTCGRLANLVRSGPREKDFVVA